MRDGGHTKTLKHTRIKFEKDGIHAHGFAPCPVCEAESRFFQDTRLRERRFLIIVEMIVTSVCCALIRFKCPGCRKSFTFYPDFALPRKHYTARRSWVCRKLCGAGAERL